LIAYLQQHSDYQFQKPRQERRCQKRKGDDDTEGVKTHKILYYSIRERGKSLYMYDPPSLEEKLRENLSKSLCELMENDCELTIADPSIAHSLLFLTIHFEE
jgi:hypothetical protein